MPHDQALEASKDERVIDLCKNNRIIIFTDVPPDARPFLLQPECDKTIKIMHLSNRFDWCIGDPEVYESLIRDSLQMKDRNFLVVANNIGDALYIESRMGIPHFKVQVIRPNGFVEIPVDSEVASNPATSNQVVYSKSWDSATTRFYELLQNKTTLDIKLLDGHYGGPATLALYKAFIFLPYQVSVMKNVQNMRFGVLTFIPSRRYYNELVRSLNLVIIQNMVTESLRDDWTDFALFCEYYQKDSFNYYYTFDSPEDLQQKLSAQDIDPQNKRALNKEMGKNLRKIHLEEWAKLFGKFGFERRSKSECFSK